MIFPENKIEQRRENKMDRKFLNGKGEGDYCTEIVWANCLNLTSGLCLKKSPDVVSDNKGIYHRLLSGGSNKLSFFSVIYVRSQLLSLKIGFLKRMKLI